MATKKELEKKVKDQKKAIKKLLSLAGIKGI